MKTENQKLAEILESKSLHGLLELLVNAKSNIKSNDNQMGETIIELIADNENSKINFLAKNINTDDPSIEDAQRFFKEVADNLTFYKNALNKYNNTCQDEAFEVLRDIYPSKSDTELRNMIG